MNKYLLFFFLCFSVLVKAQSPKTNSYAIVGTNVGAGGSSKILNTNTGKYYVSQSIGQTSVIGTYSNNGYYLRQGYQQPSDKIKVVKDLSKQNDLGALVYPNPFKESVYVSFEEDLENDIDILVFDVAGKQIFSKKFKPSRIIELNLEAISSGTYLLKVSSKNKLFDAKIIKK